MNSSPNDWIASMPRSKLSPAMFHEAVERFGTPCWIYDASEIRRRVAALSAFDVIRYAQKANSNIQLLMLLRNAGVVVDAVSLGEIERAMAAGFAPANQHDIVYASDIFERNTLSRVVELGIPVNIGSQSMLEQLGEASPGHPIWLRINPGFGSGFSTKTNTGGEWSKHGLWHRSLDECYALIRTHRLNVIGLHMHIGSGADLNHLQRVCEAMVTAVQDCPFDVKSISAGGGLPIPYRETDVEFDVGAYHSAWTDARNRIETHLGHPVSLEIEPGRYIVGTSGYLLSEIRSVKAVGSNNFVLGDAGFNDLLRPAMYGSYHEITVLPGQSSKADRQVIPTVVGGPLCEAGDVFTVERGGLITPRSLRKSEVGDLLVFHDCGAYCASMSSNYNSRGLAAEVLADDGCLRLIRRRQPLADLLKLDL